MRRFLFSLLIFFAGTFFGKTLLLEGGASCFKLYLHFFQKIDFSYETIDWREGKICIDRACIAMDELNAEISQVRISLLTKAIELDGPYVAIREIPKLEGSSNWKFSVNNGIFFRKGLGEIQFSCERNWPHQVGRFFFQKGSCSWDVEAIYEGKEMSLYANLNRFDFSLLKEWFDLQGEATGWVHLVLQDHEWKKGVAHLQVERGGVGTQVREIAGELDWEGALDSSFLNEGHLRLALKNGELWGEIGQVQKISGELTFTADLGAKCELTGVGIVGSEKFPVAVQGKTFIQGAAPEWSELFLSLDQSHFSFQSEGEKWKAEMQEIGAKEGKLLQSFFGWIDPKILSFDVQGMQVDFQAEGIGLAWDLSFQAKEVSFSPFYCKKAWGTISSQKEVQFLFSDASFSKGDLKGEMLFGSGSICKGKELTCELQGKIEDLETVLFLQGTFSEEGLFFEVTDGKVEEFSLAGTGWVGGEEGWYFQGRGALPNGIAFSFPLIERREKTVFFDLRLDRGCWDAARLLGIWQETGWALDAKTSHFAGFPILFDGELHTSLPVKELCYIAPLFFPDFANMREYSFLEGDIDLCFSFAKGKKPLYFSSEQIDWKNEGEPLCQLKLNGSINSSFQIELQVPDIWVDLELFKGEGLKGRLEGSGCFSWKEKWEADFDLLPCSCQWQEIEWENQELIHLSIDSTGRALCTGVDIQAHGSPFHLQTDLVEVELTNFLCKLHKCRLYLPPEMLLWEAASGLDCVADLEWAPDSHFSCFMKEGEIPWQNERHFVQALSCFYEKDRAWLNFQYPHPATLIEVGLFASKSEHEKWKGRLQLGEEEKRKKLSIDWHYKPDLGVQIETIDGEFSGVEASFCRVGLEEPLIGTAKIHCREISPFLSPRLVHLVQDLKMGKNYELKGKLSLLPHTFSFEGILSGKQVELFGYQFRTLLGEIAFSPSQALLSDLKLSDEAGIMKIDRIIALGEDSPWTLSIPHLSFYELRPSLLRKEGEEAPLEKAGPLVVREFKMHGLQGLLDEPKTYRATGELTFINSYRREHTVFDIPSDLLSRIVGLDLELLIPVRGQLTYELHGGLFHLKELAHSYSEAERSQFFLVPNPAPTMDLDGNLNIFVEMKQFVLFKLTESFWISIDGKLNDPQFHLQKKNRV